ncbi:hypothetical protein Trco_000498 [Trichoderma cornu-damae]|uniref:HFB protein n=1 Tax=Trichoderma cornu-damae TaxID=654480 RepID=A0A9P8TZB7_9HYPO|nr:hypothetical protein Trco_000498 [Trichoderma cornu-damae]
MRFSFVLSGLFAALAAAQGSTTSAAPPSSVSLDPAQQSQYACIKACKEGDVNCQAHCIAVPSPNQSQVNSTIQCVADCPQGDGSSAQTNAYKLCIDKCIQDHYYVTSEGTPEPTGAAGGNNAASGSDSAAASPTGSSDGSKASGSGSGSGAAETGTATGSSSGTKTASATTTSATNAAPAIIASGGALAGVLAALLAL